MKIQIQIKILIIVFFLLLLTIIVINFNKGFIFLACNKDNIEIYGMDYNKGGQYAKMFKLEEDDKNYLINLFSRKNYKLKPFHPSLIGSPYTFCIVNTKNNKEMYFYTMGNFLIINNTIFYEKNEGTYTKIYDLYKKYRPEGPKR